MAGHKVSAAFHLGTAFRQAERLVTHGRSANDTGAKRAARKSVKWYRKKSVRRMEDALKKP